MPATRAEPKILLYFTAAFGAGTHWLILKSARMAPPLFIKNSATAVALKEAFSPLDRKERNEKEAQVMVQTFETGRGQTAAWACPRLLIHLYLSGLDTAYKYESAPPWSSGLLYGYPLFQCCDYSTLNVTSFTRAPLASLISTFQSPFNPLKFL